jgi:di/tricarboxylate transporter
MSFKVTSPKDIPSSIDYNTALVIVLSLALGTAMMQSGAASLVANGVISAFLPLGKGGVLFGIYFLGALLAAYITTKASVAIVFPVALSVALQLGVNPNLCVCSCLFSGVYIHNPHGMSPIYGVWSGGLFLH